MAVTYRQIFDIDWFTGELVITKMKTVTTTGPTGPGPWLSLAFAAFDQ